MEEEIKGDGSKEHHAAGANNAVGGDAQQTVQDQERGQEARRASRQEGKARVATMQRLPMPLNTPTTWDEQEERLEVDTIPSFV